jgi:hypothetical protein
MAANDGVPAGWYTDPGGSSGQRWWDGTAWTDHLLPEAPAPAPTPPPAVAPSPVPGVPVAVAAANWPIRADETGAGADLMATAPLPLGTPAGSFGAATEAAAPARPIYGYGGVSPYGTPPGGPAGGPVGTPPKRRSGGKVLAGVLVAFLLLMGLLSVGAVLALRTAGDPSGEGASPVTTDAPLGTADPLDPADPPVPTTSTPPSTTGPAPTPAGRPFTDPQGIYELTIPPSWTAATAPMNAVEMWRTAGDGSNVGINDGPNTDKASVETLRRQLGPQMESMFKGLHVEQTDVVVSTTGQKVIVLQVTNTQTPVPAKQRLYVFVSKQRVVTATVTVPASAVVSDAFSAVEPYVLSLHLVGDI